MGSTYSVQEAKTISITGPDPLAEEIDAYKTEFAVVYKQLRHQIDYLNAIPCGNVAKDVVGCVKQNPGRIANCFGIMKSYRVCVDEATRNKLNQYVYEVGQ